MNHHHVLWTDRTHKSNLQRSVKFNGTERSITDHYHSFHRCSMLINTVSMHPRQQKKKQLRCYHLITSSPADVDDHHTKTDLSSARIEDLNHATKSISHWRWRTTRSLSPTGVGLDDLLRHNLITIWGDFEPFYRFLDVLCYFVTRLLSVFSVRKNDARHFKISINRVCISSSLLRKPSICKQSLRSMGPPSSHHKTKFVTLELLPPKSIAKRLGTFTLKSS